MRFAELPVGESLAVGPAAWPAQRVILRKSAPGVACDASGRIVPVSDDEEVEPLGRHALERAVYLEDAGTWRMLMGAPERQGAREWVLVDELEELPGDLRRVRNLLASQAHAHGRAWEAVELYTELLDEREEAAVLNNRGAAWMSVGDTEAALGDYARAIELKPDLPQAYSNRGNALSKLGRYDEALADYERALDLDDSLAAVYCNRGLTLRMQGDLISGLGDFDRALAADPEFGPGYLARGGARALQGDVPGAISDLERFLELDPTAKQAPHARVALNRLRAARSNDERVRSAS